MKALKLTAMLLVFTGLSLNNNVQAAAGKQAIDVCFVLDTTGSMSGLIDAAKQKIWFIANEIANATPTPDIRFCLIAFRDRNDQYITQHYPLTQDLDTIARHLNTFKANGGGDMPESVNQALYESVTQINWSDDPPTYRVVFLVGDSPPHMDYQNDTPYSQTAGIAAQKDIIINTLQCGNNPLTTPIWKEIAQQANGAYTQIPQSPKIQHVETIFDQDLVALNRKLGMLILPYGNIAQRETTTDKQKAAERLNHSVMSDRMAYNSRTGKIIQGNGDLIDDIDSGIAQLKDIPRAQLPEILQRMSIQQQQDYIDQIRTERQELQRIVADLVNQRANEVTNKQSINANDTFDLEVRRMIRVQGQTKGIVYQ